MILCMAKLPVYAKSRFSHDAANFIVIRFRLSSSKAHRGQCVVNLQYSTIQYNTIQYNTKSFIQAQTTKCFSPYKTIKHNVDGHPSHDDPFHGHGRAETF